MMTDRNETTRNELMIINYHDNDSSQKMISKENIMIDDSLN